MYTYIYVHSYIFTHIYTCICIYVYMCAYIYIYICIYAYTYICTIYTYLILNGINNVLPAPPSHEHHLIPPAQSSQHAHSPDSFSSSLACNHDTGILSRPRIERWVLFDTCQNGENVTSFWGIAFVASDMCWLWTGWIDPALVQMSGCCLGAVVIVWWAVAGFGRFSLTFRFFVNSHLDHSWAWIPACSPTAALLHRCFPSNLSTTTWQGAIVKLRGASSELCTLFIWSV